jgi:hypothetical protein
MNDPDNFLSRWSRRKRQAVDARPEKTDGGQVGPGPAGDQTQSVPASVQSSQGAVEFDVSSLPPIESIGPGTDLTAFMQSGVPLALRHAALRRAWSADPAIRDFMGPTENYWDAVGPDGIPGFGDLDPGLDVKRMVSELFGEKAPDAAEASVSPTTTDKSAEIIEDAQAPKSADAPVTAEKGRSEGTGNGASQKHLPQVQPEQRIARRHGGAMPE